MALNVGELEAKLTLVDTLTPALTIAGKNLTDFGGKLDKMGDKASQVGRDLLPLSVGLTAIGAASIAMSAKFEASMTRLVSIAGVGAAEIDNVTNSILDLSMQTGVGPQQLADAMTKVSSVVSDTSVAMDILTTAALGTKAGFGDTTAVAGALTTVINSYEKGAYSAAEAGDILAVAIKEGGAEASELAPVLANVIPFAAQMGISFEEVSANLATLTKLGVPTAEAVTQLSAVMTAATKETKQGADALKSVGMSYEGLRASIKDKGLMATLVELDEKFKGNITGLTDVFGRVEALRNVLGTASSQGDVYAQVLEKIKKASEGGKGALTDMADAMNETAVQSFAQLRAIVEVLAIRLGDELAPALQGVIASAIPVLKWAIDAVKWFSELPEPVKKVAIAFGALTAVSAPALMAIGSMAKGMSALVEGGKLFVSGAVGTLAAIKRLTDAAKTSELAFIALRGAQAGLIGLGIGAVILGSMYAWDRLQRGLKENREEFEKLQEASRKSGHAITDVAEAQRVLAAYEAGQAGVKLELKNLTIEQVEAWKAGRIAAEGIIDVTGGLSANWKINTDSLNRNTAAIVDQRSLTEKLRDSLKDVNKEVANFTDEQKSGIAAADAMGWSVSEIATELKLGEKAVQVYVDRLKDSKTATDKQKKSNEELTEWIKKTNDEWGRSSPGTKYMEDITKSTERMGEAIVNNALIVKNATQERNRIIREDTISAFNKAMDAVDVWAANEELTVNKTVEGWEAGVEAIQALAATRKEMIIRDSKEIQQELAAMSDAAKVGFNPEWLMGAGFSSANSPASKVGLQLGKGIKDSLKTSLANVPSIISDALTGGGGMTGAFSAIASTVGSGVGETLGKKLGTAVSSIASFAGPMGAAIGALAGPMIEMFAKMLDKTAKGVKSTAKGYGVEIGDAVVEAIKTSMKDLDMGQQEATILNADKLFPTVTVENFSDALRIVRDSFSMVATGQFDVADGAKVIDSMWGKLAAVGTDSFGRINEGMKELIQLNDQYGTQSKEIAKFLQEQSKNAGDAFNAIVKGSTDSFKSYDTLAKKIEDTHKEIDTLKKKGGETAESLAAGHVLSGDALQQVIDKENELNGLLEQQKAAAAEASGELTNLGIIAVATYGAAVEAGMTHVEALKLIAPGMQDILLAYENLGLSIEDAGLKQLVLQSTILENNPYLLEAIGGLSSSMIALDNMGRMNIETFSAMQATGMEMYTKLQAAVAEHGGAAEDALMPMQDYLHQAEEQARLLGVPLDANTQMLIDQSKELGLWKEAGKSANEQLLDGINALNDTMKSLLNNVGGIASGLRNIPSHVESNVLIRHHTEFSESTVGGGGGGENAADGGLVIPGGMVHLAGGSSNIWQPKGSDTVPAMLTPGERVLTVSENQAYERGGNQDETRLLRAIGNLTDAIMSQSDTLLMGLRDVLLERG